MDKQAVILSLMAEETVEIKRIGGTKKEVHRVIWEVIERGYGRFNKEYDKLIPIVDDKSTTHR